jgi:hypothetical protein
VKEKIEVGFCGRFFFPPESNDSFGRVFLSFGESKERKKHIRNAKYID